MRFTTALAAAVGLLAHVAQAEHGDGYEGSIMGPVAFLWPTNREWDDDDDNTGPCGSPDGPGNRTTFPLTGGEVALSIADDAYKVAFYIAFDSNPTEQSDFVEQVVNNLTEIEPGHECYKIDPVPSTVKAGSNATIQLQYWAKYGSENGGKNETFYACADVTFVEDSDFSVVVPCFNVTAVGYSAGEIESTESWYISSVAAASKTAAASAETTGVAFTYSYATGTATATSTSGAVAASSGSHLSGGAKAGIAVGSVVGGLAIIGAAAFIWHRKRNLSYLQTRQRAPLDAPIPLGKVSGEAASTNTGEAQAHN